MPSPFPAGRDLRFTRINGTIVVHHPDDERVTKTVSAQNIRKVVIRSSSISEIFRSLNLKSVPRHRMLTVPEIKQMINWKPSEVKRHWLRHDGLSFTKPVIRIYK